MLRLRFMLDERAEAFAAGRREVLLAGCGAALLLIIGIGGLSRRFLARPVEELSTVAMALAAGRSGTTLAGTGATRSASSPARSTRSAARCRRSRRGSTASCSRTR